MAKTKPIGVRIEDSIFSNVMRIAAPLGLNLSRLVEKLLLFFIRYPNEIIEFENRDPLDEALIELYKQPDLSLRLLEEKGIQTPGQLFWLADLIEKAWSRAGSATSPWVSKVVEAVHVLITKVKIKPEVMNYLESAFPERGQDLSEKIDKALARLGAVSRIDAHYADALARCFLAVVRDVGLDMPADVLSELQKLISPWCFWVGKRAIQKGPDLKEIDTTPLLRQTRSATEYIKIKKDRVLAEAFLSSAGVGPFNIGQQPFSCGFTIVSKDNHAKATFACVSQTLYELIETVTQLSGNREIARFGHWEVMRNEKESCYSIKKDGVLIFLEKEELEDFVEAVKDLYGREDVQQDLLKEYVEVYGAV